MESWIILSLVTLVCGGTGVEFENNDWFDMLVDYVADFTKDTIEDSGSSGLFTIDDNKKDIGASVWESSYDMEPLTGHVNKIRKEKQMVRNQIMKTRPNRPVSPIMIPMDRPLNILVEGNVGSGKSTLLNILSQRQSFKVFPEPVESWQKVGDQNLLYDMYREPSRWTTSFQLYSTQTRLETALTSQESNRTVNLIERSLFSERYCFVQMLANSGVVTSGEFSLLDRYFKTLTNGLYPTMDLIIYIRTDPSVLIKRIKSRGRQEETEIPVEFLTKLHEMHENWLIHKNFPLPAPVFVMDGNLDLAYFTNLVNSWADDFLPNQI